MSILLSVIMPVCCQEKNIQEAINRVGGLPLEKEIIVVNDCSGEDIESALRGVSLPGLKVIHHVSNRGKASAVRSGLENASGEFVIIREPESYDEPSVYLKLLEAIRGNGTDFVLGVRGRKPFSIKNRLLEAVFNAAFGAKINDWFSPYLVMRRESLISLAPCLKKDNISFEILTKVLRKKMRLLEVSIL